MSPGTRPGQARARMAQELRQAGFEVTENVGGTGVVALLELLGRP